MPCCSRWRLPSPCPGAQCWCCGSSCAAHRHFPHLLLRVTQPCFTLRVASPCLCTLSCGCVESVLAALPGLAWSRGVRRSTQGWARWLGWAVGPCSAPRDQRWHQPSPENPGSSWLLPYCTLVPGALRGLNFVTKLRISGFVHRLVISCGTGVPARVCASLQTARVSRLRTGMGTAERPYRRAVSELIRSAEME